MRSVSFRPLDRLDFPLMQRWLAEPHVVRWWREPLDLAGLEAKYGPPIDGTEPVRVFIAEFDGRRAGFIQWYRWSDYEDHARKLSAPAESAGIDLAIGEPALVGIGVGPELIRTFLEHPDLASAAIRTVVVDPEATNQRSLRAFAKAGFELLRVVQLPGEDFKRHVMARSIP